MNAEDIDPIRLAIFRHPTRTDDYFGLKPGALVEILEVWGGDVDVAPVEGFTGTYAENWGTTCVDPNWLTLVGTPPEPKPDPAKVLREKLAEVYLGAYTFEGWDAVAQYVLDNYEEKK